MPTDKNSVEPIEVILGSGNVFRDLGLPDPDVRQHKALIAADIIKSFDARKLTVDEAARITGMGPADFEAVRNVKLDRFTVDELTSIRALLG